ncbi:avidin-related protein 1-like [Crotalus adamanteus]|uniref:Avidin-related protein 1-like n=1 Tax=Crotalus adamanteus TaxID=8729 RepID=A0AAW1ANC3_CROAD
MAGEELWRRASWVRMPVLGQRRGLPEKKSFHPPCCRSAAQCSQKASDFAEVSAPSRVVEGGSASGAFPPPGKPPPPPASARVSGRSSWWELVGCAEDAASSGLTAPSAVALSTRSPGTPTDGRLAFPPPCSAASLATCRRGWCSRCADDRAIYPWGVVPEAVWQAPPPKDFRMRRLCQPHPAWAALGVGQSSLIGTWKNDLNSTMEINSVSNTGVFSGLYKTAVSASDNPIGPSLLQCIQHQGPQPTFGLTRDQLRSFLWAGTWPGALAAAAAVGKSAQRRTHTPPPLGCPRHTPLASASGRGEWDLCSAGPLQVPGPAEENTKPISASLPGMAGPQGRSGRGKRRGLSAGQGDPYPENPEEIALHMSPSGERRKESAGYPFPYALLSKGTVHSRQNRLGLPLADLGVPSPLDLSCGRRNKPVSPRAALRPRLPREAAMPVISFPWLLNGTRSVPATDRRVSYGQYSGTRPACSEGRR